MTYYIKQVKKVKKKFNK